MITLRAFGHDDVSLKVKWINDPQNNRYLHYTLPLEEQSTHEWLDRIRGRKDRLDLTICCDGVPVGIIGLLNMDGRAAELYITVGEQSYRGRGIAGEAMRQLCRTAFGEYGMEVIYLFTETGNTAAIRSYEKFGMKQTDLLTADVKRQDGTFADRYRYSIGKTEFEERYGELSETSDL